MECDEFRAICDSEPDSIERAYVEHAKHCATCARYLESARHRDAVLRRALRIPAPATYGRRRPSFSTGPKRPLAAAASLAVAIGLTAVLWIAQGVGAGRALAADVVKHIADEPQALAATAPVATGALDRTLRASDIRLEGGIGRVFFAETCIFRGREIPHLVVQTATGLVTVLILPEERIARATEIAENGMHGRVIPVSGHALAIVGQSHVAPVTQERILAAIGWGA
jgi:hypothetical protein